MLVSAFPLSLPLQLLRAAACAAALAAGPLAAQAADAVDLGQQLPEVQTINEGLFPEEACKELQQAGYKCMGFKPAVRFSLPTATFKLGSAELPDLLRQQLDRFAEVLRGKRGTPHVVRIEGHADATGTDDINGPLSQKRAEAVPVIVSGAASAAWSLKPTPTQPVVLAVSCAFRFAPSIVHSNVTPLTSILWA